MLHTHILSSSPEIIEWLGKAQKQWYKYSQHPTTTQKNNRRHVYTTLSYLNTIHTREIKGDGKATR